MPSGESTLVAEGVDLLAESGGCGRMVKHLGGGAVKVLLVVGPLTVPDWLLRLRLPNGGAQSVMTPTGWGAADGALFAGHGVSERNPWLPSSDGILGFGVGLGYPVLHIIVQLRVTISDLI